MEANKLRLLKDHVITRYRNDRCHYDPEVKQALIEHAASSGDAIPALAREHGTKTSQPGHAVPGSARAATGRASGSGNECPCPRHAICACRGDPVYGERRLADFQ
jgi:hypothetical protein